MEELYYRRTPPRTPEEVEDLRLARHSSPADRSLEALRKIVARHAQPGAAVQVEDPTAEHDNQFPSEHTEEPDKITLE